MQRGPGLKYNPGLIDPNNSAFNNTRRPLAAQWETVRGGNQFFTVNTHQTSKGGSTSLFGDPRPPVNLGLNQRDAEATVTGVSFPSPVNPRIVSNSMDFYFKPSQRTTRPDANPPPTLRTLSNE